MDGRYKIAVASLPHRSELVLHVPAGEEADWLERWVNRRPGLMPVACLSSGMFICNVFDGHLCVKACLVQMTGVAAAAAAAALQGEEVLQ